MPRARHYFSFVISIVIDSKTNFIIILLLFSFSFVINKRNYRGYKGKYFHFNSVPTDSFKELKKFLEYRAAS